MTSRHRITLDRPADFFIDAFVHGNGSIGASTYGRVGIERIDLNLDTLWSGGPISDPVGDGAAGLLKVREAIARHDYQQADESAIEMQGSSWTQSYQPVGGVLWNYSPAEAIRESYARTLDIDSARSTTSFRTANKTVELEVFASAADGVVVASVRGGFPAESLEFDIPHPHRIERLTELDGEVVIVTGRAPALVLPNYVDDPYPVRYGDDAVDADGRVAAGMGFAVVIRRQSFPGGHSRLLIAGETGFLGPDQCPSADVEALSGVARARVDAAAELDTDELRGRHTAEFRTFADRADLDLSGSATPSAEAAELFFHYCRYLLISSSRPGTAPANLQGIWNVDVRPGWSSNYTTNINAEMNYWAAETIGLADCHTPLLNLIGTLAERGKSTARAHYGLPGATVHHNTDIWGFTLPVCGEPQWANWPTGLLWLATHVLDHRDFASDEEAATTSLTAVEESLRFGLGLLVADENGNLVISPSTSPEHRFIENGVLASVTSGSAMDQELFIEVATRYLGAVGNGGDLGLVADLVAALPDVALPAVGSDGLLLEWGDERLQPSELDHRHLSHLWGLYPGMRITETGTPEHFDAAAAALAKRLENGSGYTGWSQAWVLCLAARLRDHALADRAVDTLLNALTSHSLLDLHPHGEWPGGQIFQIDGNFGALAGIAELLLQSHEGSIALLKTLPISWPEGSVSGFRARGGHHVSFAWSDGLPVSARVIAGRTGQLTIDVPDGVKNVTVSAEGQALVSPLEALGATGRKQFTFPVDAQHDYELSFA